jgi:hypothetical protein
MKTNLLRKIERYGTYAEVSHYAVNFILNYDVEIETIIENKKYRIVLYKINTLDKNKDNNNTDDHVMREMQEEEK